MSKPSLHRPAEPRTIHLTPAQRAHLAQLAAAAQAAQAMVNTFCDAVLLAQCEPGELRGYQVATSPDGGALVLTPIPGPPSGG